ncbi:MAG: hypothetical protein R3Y43_08525 [Alphaproteobacteria bacterium]
MKNWFLNILMLGVVVILYHIKFFEFITSKGFNIFSYLIIIIMFLIGIFVIGTPFNGKKK